MDIIGQVTEKFFGGGQLETYLDNLGSSYQDLTDIPPVSTYFMVIFFHKVKFVPIPNLLDMRFKTVTGIGSSVVLSDFNEGGQNQYIQNLPDTIAHENIVLERALVSSFSPLNLTFDNVMSFFQFNPMEMLISVLDTDSIPVFSWLFRNAYPVNWALSDLDAENDDFIIETMELTYQNFYPIYL